MKTAGEIPYVMELVKAILGEEKDGFRSQHLFGGVLHRFPALP